MLITRKMLNKYFLQMLHSNNYNGERYFENVLKKQVFDASFQKYTYIYIYHLSTNLLLK